MDRQTIRYYRTHAATYARATRGIELAACRSRFMRHLADGASILDVGAGSGRDLQHFLAAGYLADGIDASPEMAAEASAFTGVPIRVASVERFASDKLYDGIWANAVLLHLARSDLENALHSLCAALREGGTLFMSFRVGGQRFRHADGRLFYGMNRRKLESLLCRQPLSLLEHWEEADHVHESQDQSWFYAILRRQ